MNDTVYIPLIISQAYFRKNHFGNFINHVRNFDTPEGVKIISVEECKDSFMFNVLDQIKLRNPVNEKDIDQTWDSPEYLMCIDFEVEEEIHFNLMPWFEEQVISTIEKHEEYCEIGLYYFYLINDGKEFRSRNIAKADTGNGIKIFLDQEGDDSSFLQEVAPFLGHFWYKNSEISVMEVFPVEAAKFLLLFDL